MVKKSRVLRRTNLKFKNRTKGGLYIDMNILKVLMDLAFYSKTLQVLRILLIAPLGGVVFVFRLIRRVRVRTELSTLLLRTVPTFVAQLIIILLRLMIHTDPMRSPIPRPLALFPRLDHRH